MEMEFLLLRAHCRLQGSFLVFADTLAPGLLTRVVKWPKGFSKSRIRLTVGARQLKAQ